MNPASGSKALPHKPLLLSPVDKVEEVNKLVEAGADELYAGAIPDGWGSKALSPNQRTFASAHFTDEGALKEAIEEAASKDTPLHVTLNSPLYPPEYFGELISFGERVISYGAATLIVGDPGLLLRFGRLRKPPPITLSTLAGAMNSAALGFFLTPDVERVVLPRHLNLKEMATMRARWPETLFEAFVLIGRCPNEEAYCTFQHVSPEKRWPCEIGYRVFSDGEATQPIGEHPFVKREKTWSEADRRLGCGLCALEELRRAGVGVVKLVGRGGPTAGKIANVKLVRSLLDQLDSVEGEVPAERGAVREAYRQRFGRECVRDVCYFPELFGQP